MKAFARTGLSLLAAGLLALPAAGQSVGKSLGEPELKDFGNTEAKSLDDYYGRALLIEFFAYW